MVVTIALWVFEVIGEYIVGLLLLLAWVVLGIVPSKVALAEFATNSQFLAHRLGELVFSANGKAIPFDISFDEDSGFHVP
jgi:hypothetical protein